MIQMIDYERKSNEDSTRSISRSGDANNGWGRM